MILIVTIETNAFADRTLLIPELPKQPFRYGVGAFEGVVAHSTATLRRQQLIFKNMSLVHGVRHLFIIQLIGKKRFK